MHAFIREQALRREINLCKVVDILIFLQEMSILSTCVFISVWATGFVVISPKLFATGGYGTLSSLIMYLVSSALLYSI